MKRRTLRGRGLPELNGDRAHARVSEDGESAKGSLAKSRAEVDARDKKNQLRHLHYPGPRSSMNINTVARMSRSKNA